MEQLTDADLIDQIRAHEETKAKAAAAQVRLTMQLKARQEAAQRQAGLPAKKVGLGIGSQVALAKRESPAKGRAFITFAEALTTDLPHTLAALEAGRIPEHRARTVVTRTADLSPELRRLVDQQIAGSLESWGDREVEAEVTKWVQRLDAHGAFERAEKAAAHRRVTLRTAPDSMAFLTGTLPAAHAVAAHAALTRAADEARRAGDTRAHDQVMADTLVERLTGQTTATAVPVALDLVMTDQTLLDAGPHRDEPAHLIGYGPLPAQVARQLLLANAGAPSAPSAPGAGVFGTPGGRRPGAELPEALDDSVCTDCGSTNIETTTTAATTTPATTAAADVAEAEVWLRRLFTDPESGQLAAIDSRARDFRGPLRRLLIARDQRCRTPWCGAPIRHLDHAVDDAHGGPTNWRNGNSLCEACNYAKTAPGWTALPLPGPAHEILIATPTGHRYRSRPPEPPRTTDTASRVEQGGTLRDPLTDEQLDHHFDLIVEDLRRQLEQDHPERLLELSP